MCTKNRNYMMYASWDIECNRQILFCHFRLLFPLLPLPPSLQPEKSKFWKNEKQKAWRYYHFTHAYHRWQSYDVKFLRYGAQLAELFIILAIFCSFTPLATQKIKILKKWRKKTGDIIILHECTKNPDHMLHCSWDMVLDGCNFGLFSALLPP